MVPTITPGTILVPLETTTTGSTITHSWPKTFEGPALTLFRLPTTTPGTPAALASPAGTRAGSGPARLVLYFVDLTQVQVLVR